MHSTIKENGSKIGQFYVLERFQEQEPATSGGGNRKKYYQLSLAEMDIPSKTPTDPSFSSVRSDYPPRNTNEYKEQEAIKCNKDINLLRDDIYSLYYNECKLIFEYYLNDKLLSMLNNSPCMGIEELRIKMHGAKSEYNKIKECDSYDKLKEHKSLSERRNNKLGSYVLMNEQVLITSILKVELELNIKVENSTVDMESVSRGMETIVQLIEFNDKEKNILVRILSALASHIFPLTHSKREKEKEAYIVELKELAYMIMGLNDGNRDILTKRELFNKAVYCSLLKNIPAKYSFDPLGILSSDRTAWLKLLRLNEEGASQINGA